MPSLSDGTFRAVVIGGALLIAGAVGFLRFCGGVEVPAKPPRPAQAAVRAADVVNNVSATQEGYAEYLAKDAKAFGIANWSLADMGKKLVHRIDESTYTLDPNRAEPLDVAGLRLTASQGKAQGERLLMLSIENRTSTPLAYRIDTSISKGGRKCAEKTNLSHNAMVVAAGATERRSECGYVKGSKLTLTRVETLALSPLSAAYVSAVPPIAVVLDARATKGHRPVGVDLCSLMPSQSLAKAVSDGRTTWRDMVDFYARHRCQSYRFPDGYQAFAQDDAQPLPAAEP